jgi:hypothetical protein
MTLVFLLAFLWLSARTLMLLAQVGRHTPEARLGREFARELRERGLLPATTPRTSPRSGMDPPP